MKTYRARMLPVIGVVLYLLGGIAASAPLPLLNYGGPVLNTVQIVPVFWGDWTDTEVTNQHNYLVNLADYISGKNAPGLERPVIAQYGVTGATVAAAIQANQPSSPTYVPPSKYISTCPDTPPAVAGTIYYCDPPTIIAGLQASSVVPPFGSDTLIILYLGKGYILDPACNCASYHQAVTTAPSFYAVVPLSPPTSAYPGKQLHGVTSHEIFETATDPYPNFPSQWGWLTGPYDTKGDVYEAADQCSAMINIPWATAADGTLSFAQITDNSNSAMCATYGYIPDPWLPPIGVWNNHTLSVSLVIAGPITPAPGSPVEVSIGFVDLNGNAVVQPSIVQLTAGQVSTVTFNANVVAGQGQHVSVMPVISQVGSYLPAVQASAEVFDSTSGDAAALASAPTTPARVFGAQGLVGGQTMRIAVVAPPSATCAATLSFAGATGNAIGSSLQVNLAAGHASKLDLTAAAAGVAAGQRIEVRPVVMLQTPDSGSVACAASSEVFETATGQTATYQTMAAQQFPQTTPPNTVDPGTVK
jgi:hypothetical protein